MSKTPIQTTWTVSTSIPLTREDAFDLKDEVHELDPDHEAGSGTGFGQTDISWYFDTQAERDAFRVKLDSWLDERQIPRYSTDTKPSADEPRNSVGVDSDCFEDESSSLDKHDTREEHRGER